MRNDIVLKSEAEIFGTGKSAIPAVGSFHEDDMMEEQFFYINSGEIRIPFFRIYLDSVESKSPAKLCDMLRSIPEGARVLLYINNPGGDLFNTMQIVNAMNDCPAEVIAIADGKVISAASIIFLSADKFIVKDNSFMMCHYYSGGVFGKGHEMQSQLSFYDEINKDFMRKSYEGFLSPEEFERMTKGEDFWFTKEQIEDRLIEMLLHRRENPMPPKVTELIGEPGEDDVDPLGGVSEDDIILLAGQIKKNRAAEKRAAAKEAKAKPSGRKTTKTKT
jgi:ATP-dependent protease ClpP protease subunit